MRRNVPIFNNPDGTQCFQSTLRSVLKFFEPQPDFTWEQLEQISQKEPGLWTWPMAAILWLQARGYEVKVVEDFDYSQFASLGEAYLVNKYGPVVADEQIRFSNLPIEQHRARDFTKKISVDQRIPQAQEVVKYVRAGYLVQCVVNSRRLRSEPGYVGHFILVTGFSAAGFYINDPGGRRYGPRKDCFVPFDEFEAAWADPNPGAKGFIAIKLATQQ